MATEQLIIGETSFEIVKRYVNQGLNEIGLAVFLVRMEETPEPDLVQYYCSVLNEPLSSAFYGHIHTFDEITPGVFKLICRENTALLESEALISIQHPTPKKILEELNRQTGLDFIYSEDAPYMEKLAPYFYSLSNARFAINSMPALFGLKFGVWFQLKTGQVYWGEWQDSHFSVMNPVPLDYDMVSLRNVVDDTIKLPLVPDIIPGMRIQDTTAWGDTSRLITKLELGDMEFKEPDQMTLKCINIFPD